MELVSFDGASAWLVYNKVIFNLAFLPGYNVERRCFHTELAKITQIEDIEEIRERVLGLASETIPKSRDQKECLAIFKSKDDVNRKLDLLECLTHIELDNDEMFRLLRIHKDPNGFPYNRASLGNISIDDLVPMLLTSLLQASKTDVDLSLVSEAEIKDLEGKRLNVKDEINDLLSTNSNLSVSQLLSLAIKKALGRTNG